MNQYITGKMIKDLWEKRNMTQIELDNKLNISSKAILKWETGKGFHDVSLLEDLANSLDFIIGIICRWINRE